MFGEYVDFVGQIYVLNQLFVLVEVFGVVVVVVGKVVVEGVEVVFVCGVYEYVVQFGQKVVVGGVVYCLVVGQFFVGFQNFFGYYVQWCLYDGLVLIVFIYRLF